jgi:hypothetical protein
VPALGSGRIFPVSAEAIAIEAISIARHWLQIGGLDFGWDHRTAPAKLAWDRDKDKTRRRKGGTYPLSHLYGHFGLVRLCRLGHDVPWVKA